MKIPKKTVVTPSLVVILLLTVFPLPWATASQASARSGSRPVVLQLRWRHQFQFAGYYAAEEKGYYRDAGFDVTIRQGGYGVATVEEVAEGRATYGVSNSEILLHRLRGAKVVVLAAVFQHSPLVFVARKDTGIESPQDLVGKRVKMTTKSRDAELHAMLQSEGITLDRLNLIEGSVGLADFFDRNVDALTAYLTNEPFHLKSRRIDVTIIRPLAYGIDFYGDCLFTSEAEAGRRPDEVRAFRDASLRGWVYAMNHPDEIIDLIRARYNSDKSRDHLAHEARAMADLILPELVEPGHMNPGRWRHIADTFVSLGFVAPDYSLEGFLFQPERGIAAETVQTIVAVTTGIILMAFAGLLAMLLFNRRLMKEITERKAVERRLEEARRATESAAKAKSDFFANMSHEIRTPLNAVIGFSELLAPMTTDARQRHYVEAILAAGRSLLGIINDILDLSKIEADRIDMVWAPMGVRSLVNGIRHLFSEKAAAKGLTFEARVDDTVPETLVLDENRLRQILTNLVDNALKFTEKGYVRLSAECRINAASATVDLVLTVADTGIGIIGDEIDRVFEPFRQQRTHDSRRFGGTGLGLAICKRLTDLMNGEISVWSRPGEGSIFEVVLKSVAVASATDPNAASAVAGTDAVRFSGERVLVVDDIESNRDLLRELFKRAGLAVRGAESGADALEIARAFQPALIVMDIRMPGMDGFEVTRRLKAEPATSHIPVFAMSASANPEQIRSSKCDDLFARYFGKPVDFDALIEAVAAFIPRKAPPAETLRTSRTPATLTEALAGEAGGDLSTDVEAPMQADLRRRLAEAVEAELTPIYVELEGTLVMKDVSRFGEKAMRLGNRYGSRRLVEYGGALVESVKRIDVNRMNELLSLFPRLARRLTPLSDENEAPPTTEMSNAEHSSTLAAHPDRG